MRRRLVSLLLVLVSMLVVSLGLACGPTPTATPAPPAAPSPTPPTTTAWQKTWEDWLAAAKKEGKLVIYSVFVSAELRQALTDGFKKTYGIDAEILATRGTEAYERLIKEREAGITVADLHLGPPLFPLIQLMPASVLDPIPPTLILPEVVDQKLWYGGKHQYVDEAGQYIFSLPGGVGRFLTINTGMVKAEEILTWDDLLDPKWKGKIATGDPTIPSTASGWFIFMTEEWKSPDWMRQFVPQVDAINRDDRMISEWVARGKYAMAIADRNTYLSFKEAGLPIDLIAPTKSPGVMSGGPSISLINKAPHANAAKVFINWYLSKEGQTVYSKAVGEPSVRLDVPTGHLDPRTLPEPGKTYFNQSTEKWLKGVMAKQAQRTALAKEIFAPLLEKR